MLEINGHRLLLDCGLYQGRREETYSRNLNFAYDPRKIDVQAQPEGWRKISEERTTQLDCVAHKII